MASSCHCHAHPPAPLFSRGSGSRSRGAFCTTSLDRRSAIAPFRYISLLLPVPQLELALGGLQTVRAQSGQDEAVPPVDTSQQPLSPKQSLLEALDFSAVRSPDDAQLLEDARSATSMGEKMSREQYAALRRKIGGTYRDFFKDSIEVEGEFVDEGWVDKSCRFCKKDTASEPRTVDKFGRYAHISCLEKSKSGNFFTRLFGM